MAPDSPRSPTLAGRRIAVTAERRGEEQAELFRKRGAEVVHVPTMHTVDLTADDELRRLTETVIARPPHWTVATTGFGMRLWFEAADAWGIGDQLVQALGDTRVVARGPKAQSACRQRGLEVVWRAENESMAEVIDWLSGRDDIGVESIVLQLFDPEDHPTTAQLGAIASSVTAVPVYRWRMPDDVDSIEQLVSEICDGLFDAVTFTSQPAVRFLFDVAARAGRTDDLVAAFRRKRPLPVCIGSVCAEPLAAVGVDGTVWPTPFRLLPMIKLVEVALADSSS